MRISVFVDGANFYYMQKRLGWWADYKKVLDFVRTKGELVDAVYYVGVDAPPEARQQSFLNFLGHVGFSLETKTMKTILQDDGTGKRKANLDIEIVLDMFNTIDHYDMAVLFSGDGDFERPLRLLKARGKRFLVLSTQGFVAKEILRWLVCIMLMCRILESTSRKSIPTEMRHNDSLERNISLLTLSI